MLIPIKQATILNILGSHLSWLGRLPGVVVRASLDVPAPISPVANSILANNRAFATADIRYTPPPRKESCLTRPLTPPLAEYKCSVFPVKFPWRSC